MSNPIRFAILGLVRDREMTAGDIAGHFKATRPAVSQHLRVLRKAGLLTERRVGAKRLYVVREEGFDVLRVYLAAYWNRRLRRLKIAAESIERTKRST